MKTAICLLIAVGILIHPIVELWIFGRFITRAIKKTWVESRI